MWTRSSGGGGVCVCVCLWNDSLLNHNMHTCIHVHTRTCMNISQCLVCYLTKIVSNKTNKSLLIHTKTGKLNLFFFSIHMIMKMLCLYIIKGGNSEQQSLKFITIQNLKGLALTVVFHWFVLERESHYYSFLHYLEIHKYFILSPCMNNYLSGRTCPKHYAQWTCVKNQKIYLIVWRVYIQHKHSFIIQN